MTQNPVPKPGILQIAPYVAGKSKAAHPNPTKLSSNENPFGPSPLARQAYQDAAAKLHRYPDPSAGLLRNAIGQAEGLNPEQIVCGAGSDELIGLLVHAYAGEDDEVIISQHGFLMYKIYTQAAGATPVFAPERNLTAQVDALLAAVTPRSKIVFLANPNNPTGSYLPAGELQRLRTGLPSHVILVIDGAYAEYPDAADYIDGRTLVDAGENTVMLRTFSKIHGLPALRLGWGYFPPAIADTLNRVRGPFNVSGPSIAAGVAAIQDLTYIAQAKASNNQWLHWLHGELTALNLIVHPSQANFLLVEFPPEGKFSAQAVNDYLLSQGIIVRDVAAYGLPNHLRITIGTPAECRDLATALRTYFA